MTAALPIEPTQSAIVLEALGARLAEILRPPPRYTVSQWADEHRYLSREDSSKPGKFRSSFAPYQRGPMDDVHDPTVRTITLRMASQTGKSEILKNVCAYFIAADPAPQLMVQPTVEFAESWSKERFVPMVRDCAPLAGRVSDPKSRNSGNTILLKTYPGGSLAIVGANSPAGLAGRPRRVVLLDEVDRFPASAGTEGDPCVLAERRTESYWNPVIIRCSSPTLLRASRIDQAMELTDCRQWQVQCPRCQGAQVLAWRQVRWPEDKPEEAWLECDHCQARLTDAERVAMVRAGQWQATKPFNGHRGYHLNGINSPFPHKRGYSNRLHQMAAEFLEAKAGGRQTLKPWVNTFLAESWQEEGFSMELSALAGRAEDYGPTLPAGVLLVTASVDVQADRLEYEITGWGFGQERWGIEYRVLPGVTTQPTVWAELDAILLRGAWTTADGRRLTVTIATIDSAGFTDHVHAFCKPRFHRRVFAIRGSNQPGQPIAGLPSRANRLRCPVFRVGTDTAKRLIFDRLQLTKPGPGTFHWPKDTAFGFDDQYFSMLTAEEIRIVYHKGFQRYEWHKTRPRNEALDITVYSFAAVQILRPNWEALAGHEPGAAPPEPPSAGDLTPTPPRAPRPAPRPAPWSRRAPNPWNRRKWR